MSVAEALGGDARAPGVGSRGTRFVHGLRIGDVGSFQQEASRRSAGNSEDGRHEGANDLTHTALSKATGTRYNNARQSSRADLLDPRLPHEVRQESTYHHVQESGSGDEGISERDTRLAAGTNNPFSTYTESYLGSRQQQEFSHYIVSPRSQRMTPQEMEEYGTKLDDVSEEKKLAKQQRDAERVKHQVPFELRSGRGDVRLPYFPAQHRGNSDTNE
ncbi:unnamed protein product, partial [Candidula unifasciata]